MKKTVAFCTLGCKVNQYETDAMRGSFEAEGYEVKEFSQEASVYVINTCTVTNMADRKSRQMLASGKEKESGRHYRCCRLLCTGGKGTVRRRYNDRPGHRQQYEESGRTNC